MTMPTPHPALLTLAALAFFLPSPATVAEDASHSILALEQTWLDGLLRRDRAVFERILDDDLRQVGLAGESADKAEFLRFFAVGDWTYLSAELEDVRVTVRGETAVSTGRVRRSLRVGGRETAGPFAFTHVWVRRPGGWRVLHSHVTPVAEPASGIRVRYRLRVKPQDEARFRAG